MILVPIGNIQFDDPLLAYFCHENMLKGMAEYGTDSEALLDSYIGLYNDSLKCKANIVIIFNVLIFFLLQAGQKG